MGRMKCTTIGFSGLSLALSISFLSHPVPAAATPREETDIFVWAVNAG
jgi:hypothetical protein